MLRLIPLAAAFLAATFARGKDAHALAERILRATSRPVGLVHLPRCGGGALALALAAGDKNLRLHGQDGDDARVAQARRAADEKGLLGRRVWFDHGGLARLLPAGRSADLVVLTDLKAGELTPELVAEIRRVLHPWYGVAVVGDASGALDATALRTWAGSIAKHVAALPGEGALVAVQADPLPGADDWAQWWHGSDNNPVSTDTAFSLPATIQWTGKPYFGPTRIELPIVSGGRLFMLWNGHEMDSSAGPPAFADATEGDGPVLMAQAAGSGARLWLRRLSPAAWVQVSRSIVVGDGALLLVADGNRILELDAATGKEKRYTPLDCPEIKWMTLHEGRLFILGGSVTKNLGRRSEKNLVPFRSSGLTLMALDRKSFAPIWRVDRQAGKDAFDPRSPAIDGDRLFLCREGDTAEALSVKDGKSIWTVKAGFPRTPGMTFQDYEWDATSRHPVSGYAMAGVYVISGAEMLEAVVLAQSDGRRLWTTPTPGRSLYCPLAFWGLIWKDATSLNPVTGKPLGKMKVGMCRVAREGEGRDFAIDAKADTSGVPGGSEVLGKSFRLVTGPTNYSVEDLAAGGAYVIRLRLLEPWNDKAGRRLMDVAVNGTEALKGFDVFAAAGGRNKALVRDLPSHADEKGRLAIRISGTQGCPDPNPVLCGIEIRQGAETLARFQASGPFVPVKGFRPFNGNSCARSTMAPFLADTPYAPPEPLKTSCSAGSFVADGLLWKFPVPCVGCMEWRGLIAQASREEHLPKPPERLHRGADAPVAASQAPQGWLTYRGNPQRSLFMPVGVPAKARIRWQTPPLYQAGRLSHHTHVLMDAEFVPTPPLAADNRVIVAQADGAVDALDLASGKRLWRAYTSGRVHSSPTVWQDRVFVGSADGHLYAFSLADGRELWRLRAAPETGRVMVYEQLASRWPILGSPVVADGKVVVSAGLIDMVDGVRAVCADAASGKVLWECSDWSASESGGRISGGAQFALAGELFYHGGMAPPVRIDPQDGSCRPAFSPTSGTRLGPFQVSKWRTGQAFAEVWSSVKGQDIGALSQEWLMYGGRRILTDQAENGIWRSNIVFLGRDRDGNGRLPVVSAQDCGQLPAWDEQDAVFICNLKFNGLVMIPRDKLLKALDALMAGPSTAEILALDNQPPKQAVTVPRELISRAFTAHAEGLFTWSSAFGHGWHPLACALTRNSVLVVTTQPDWQNPARDIPGKITALSRADGGKMWEINLPARAVHNGLAVAADGSVVLALMDGQTLCIGTDKGQP
ncbi:MAG TPA: PQQ-binding-like beta-propeller repeat protein [Planctomycetota bacterium]|nr:PQQ-binding-like beta-propeller repeat protein [Planctomycetota bacterium]